MPGVRPLPRALVTHPAPMWPIPWPPACRCPDARPPATRRPRPQDRPHQRRVPPG